MAKAKGKTDFRSSGGFQEQKWAARDDLRDLSQELKKQVDYADELDKIINKKFKVEEMSLAAAKSTGKITKDTTKEQLRQRKLDQEAIEFGKEMVDDVKQRLDGFRKLLKGARLFNLIAKANPYLLLVGIIVAIGAAFLKFQKAVADTRKELGVSAIEAAKLQARFFALGVAGKAFGLEAEDMKESFDAIRSTFGGINEATNRFVFSLAKAKLFTGASAEDLARVISLQESI